MFPEFNKKFTNQSGSDINIRMGGSFKKTSKKVFFEEVFSITVFGIAILLSGVSFGLLYFFDTKIEEKNAILESKREEFQISTIKDLDALHKQINIFKKFTSRRKHFIYINSLASELVGPGTVYSNLSILFLDDSQYKITIEASSSDFVSFLRQLRKFNTNTNLLANGAILNKQISKNEKNAFVVRFTYEKQISLVSLESSKNIQTDTI